MQSSFDLLLLALIDEGLTTPYALMRVGISIGASHPALQRLHRGELVRKGKAGARGKIEYQPTKSGRAALEAWPDLLRQYLGDPPADIESVLRMTALAWTRGKRRDALKLLERAAQASAQIKSSPAVLADANDLPSMYKSLTAVAEAERWAGERRALRLLLSSLRRGRR